MRLFIRKFKSLILIISRKKQVTRNINYLFKYYPYYLKPGKYKYDPITGTTYKLGLDLKQLPFNVHATYRKMLTGNLIQNLILRFFFFFIRPYGLKVFKSNKLNQFNAEFILSRGDNGVKLFDFYQKKILTIMDANQFDEKIEEINVVNDNFNTPIKAIKKTSNVIIEDWVDFDDASQIKEKNGFKAFNQFVDDLVIFSSKYDFEKSLKINSIDVINSLKSNPKTKQMFNLLNKNILNDLQNLPIIFNRINFFYDIGLGNFNIKNNQYHLIDYDGFQDIPPINVFFRILLSLSNSTKMRPILFYKSGYFDERLKALFAAEKSVYDSNSKDIYFVLSQLIEIYILYGNTTISDDIIKKYVKFFKKYFSIKPNKEEIKNHF